MNCDSCQFYNWYYDWCSKWNCEVDSRSIQSCFMRREKDEKR